MARTVLIVNEAHEASEALRRTATLPGMPLSAVIRSQFLTVSLAAFTSISLAACSSSPESDTEEEPDFTLGEPIALSSEQHGQWVWIDHPEMRCSKGEDGGFAVNFTTESRELVIYLQGGGICYDELTCLAGGARTSVGADPVRTALDGPVRDMRGIFNRSDEKNPFRNANFVVVPHCTGDHHTGNQVSEYGNSEFHHVGYTNITRMLERVVPTFADASRVTLSGFSAGGVGITANYHQLAKAFESVGQPAPYLVIDSGPFLRPPYLTTTAQADLRVSWGLDGTVGTFCPSCLESGFHEMYRVNGELHPGLRSSLVATYEDSVVKLLYGVLNGETFTSEAMREGLHDVADWGEETFDAEGRSQHRVFFYEGEGHGVLHIDALTTTPKLLEFLEGQLGTGEWRSVRD